MILTYQIEPGIYTVAIVSRNVITRMVGLTKEQAGRAVAELREEEEQC